MKNRIIRIAALAAAVVLSAACGKQPKAPKALDITGEWNLIRIETKSAQIGDQTVDVYIAFEADKTFNMYQMLGAGRYKAFSGTWTLMETTLSGRYSDGSAWGSTYEVSVDGNTMVLTGNGEIDTYTRRSIPASVVSSGQ